MAALALGACSTTMAGSDSATDSPRGDCFRPQDVSGYGLVDEHHVRLSVGTRDYIATVAGTTRRLDWNHAIALHSRDTFVCTGNGIDVQLMGGEPPIPLQVTAIERVDKPAPQGS